MQLTVDVSNEILNWVMSHIRMDTLPEKTISYLNLWSSGEKKPTFNQLEDVSKKTGIPFGYFFLQSPPDEDLSLVDYRTVDSIELTNPSRNLIDTIHNMEQVQEWTREHLLAEGEAPVEFVGNLKDETNIIKFALNVRKILGIDIEWYNNVNNSNESFNMLRKAMSNVGVLIMRSGIVENNTHRPLDINEFRAFAMVDEYAPLIFINSNDSINGRLFSLIHEFAHICIGENSLFNDRYNTASITRKTETICNAVAAEILVPQSLFVEKWNEAILNNEVEWAIDKISKTFHCGTTVIARKSYDNGYVDIKLYNKIAQQAVKMYNEFRKKQKEKEEGGGDYYRTAASRMDTRFFDMIVNSVNEGKTLYSDAFRLTNTNRMTFNKLVENAGG